VCSALCRDAWAEDVVLRRCGTVGMVCQYFSLGTVRSESPLISLFCTRTFTAICSSPLSAVSCSFSTRCSLLTSAELLDSTVLKNENASSNCFIAQCRKTYRYSSVPRGEGESPIQIADPRVCSSSAIHVKRRTRSEIDFPCCWTKEINSVKCYYDL
jgi:hypothetical protein